MATKANNESKGIVSRAKRFINDLRGEVKKVVWPGKKQIMNNTGIVIVVVLIAAFFIGGFDMILTALINLLFGAA